MQERRPFINRTGDFYKKIIKGFWVIKADYVQYTTLLRPQESNNQLISNQSQN